MGVIGFAIDYVVHLGHAYLDAPKQDSMGNDIRTRDQRLKYALTSMGISVTSGAFTTALSGVPLMFSQMMFLWKMGVLIISTVSFSLFWALCFFTSCVYLVGPEYDTGTFSNLICCCCGNSFNDMEDETYQKESDFELG